MHPCSAKGGGGMYRFQPGQRAPEAEDHGQEHTGRCLVASSFLWPAEITIVIWKRAATAIYNITYLQRCMANKRGDRPFVTINLKVSDEEYSKLKDLKDGETWEGFFLRVAGI